jgi:hypothetical protein
MRRRTIWQATAGEIASAFRDAVPPPEGNRR